MMAPNAKRFYTSHCYSIASTRNVFSWPAALYDSAERVIPLSATAQGLTALLLESHGIALLKNPLSTQPVWGIWP
jgi:hypothetical protein